MGEYIVKKLENEEKLCFLIGCYSTDIIGSCAFGLECNSFKDPDSTFLTYGKKIFSRNKLQLLAVIFATSFPNLARALHVKIVPPEVTTFFSDVVAKTVEYREKNNVARTDFLQLLIDIKNNKEDQPVSIKGESI